MVKEYTIKELRTQLGKVLKEVYTMKEGVVITKNGKPCARITFYDGAGTPLQDQGSTIGAETSTRAVEAQEKPQAERIAIARASISEYGCGCKKESKSPLCQAHGRY